MLAGVHAFIQPFAVGLELAGVAVIQGGVIVSTIPFGLSGRTIGNWRNA